MNHGGLGIWDSDEYAENSVPIEILSAECVMDDPEAPQLLKYPDHRPGTMINFRVRTETTFPIIKRLMKQHAPKALRKSWPDLTKIFTA